MVNVNGITGSYAATTIGDSTTVVPAHEQRQIPSTEPHATDNAAPVVNLLQKDKFSLSISEEIIVKAIEKANKAVMGPEKKFEYSVHKGSGGIVVKVLNAETNELIREIPPEKLLNLIDKLREISGAIIDEKR